MMIGVGVRRFDMPKPNRAHVKFNQSNAAIAQSEGVTIATVRRWRKLKGKKK